MVTTITSRNGRLEVGMTRESLQQKIAAQGMSESDRAAKKLMKAFEMADGLGYDGVRDGVISEAEIEAYDKEMKKKAWKTGLAIAGGIVVTAVTAWAIRKGIKLNKELEATKNALTETQSALTTTEGVLTDTEKVLGDTRKAMGYGSGTIKAGDKALTEAFAAETKGGKATFTLAEGNERFPNLWDKTAYYTPNEGNIIMGYGNAEASWGIKHTDVLKEMEAKGLTSFPDRAVSAEPDLMYRTYIGQEGTASAGRNFLEHPLVPGETVPAQKKIFPAPFTFAEAGTTVQTLEAASGSADAVKLGIGQFIQVDVNGNPYVKDVKDLVKRLNPKGEVSEEIFAKIKEFIKFRDGINGDKLLAESTKTSAIARGWEAVLEEIKAMA